MPNSSFELIEPGDQRRRTASGLVITPLNIVLGIIGIPLVAVLIIGEVWGTLVILSMLTHAITHQWHTWH